MRIAVTMVALATACCLGVTATAGPAHANKEALPPGLQKNVEKGKPLPPGWRKKLSVGDTLGSDIYARGKVVVPVGDDGSITIEVEGTLFRLQARTRRILEIL